MNTLLEHAKSQFDLVTDEKVRTLVREMLSIANEMHLDTQTRVAGLLYYPYTLGLVDEEKIETEYSQEIFTIVKSLDKLEQLNYSQQKIEAENLRKMFFAITKDIQVIMLKLAFVIARMRHLYDKTDDEQLAFCNAVMDLYAPLSARLGLSSYKTELEDKAFLRLKPHEYADVVTQVGERYVEREAKVNKLIDLVKECMAELDIKGRVSGRKKHIYSMVWSGKTDRVTERMAFRRMELFVEKQNRRGKAWEEIPKGDVTRQIMQVRGIMNRWIWDIITG